MSGGAQAASADAGSAGPRGQITRATVMFADVVGFTELAEKIGPEGAYFAVTGALKVLDGIARRHGGSVDKYLGDSIMVVFGHPVPTPDAAGAAAAAALEMREQFREYRAGLDVAAVLDLVVGINTGTMVAGELHGGAIREFHVLGDAVNVAARLKAKAPRGAIYVGPETEEETKDVFTYAPLGPMRLKGKTAEVPIFELTGSQARRSGAGTGVRGTANAPLVGRASELERLASRLADLSTGRGGVVFIVGEEGIGKSRLVAETETLPAAGEAAFIHAKTGVGSQTRAEGLLADLLLACAPETSAARPTTDLIVERLRTRAGRGLVVVLEDLHDADPDSLDLLPDLIARSREEAVLFLLTVRPDAAGAYERLRAALPPSTYDEIRLGPLAADDGRRLVEALGGGTLSDESRDMILERGGGFPSRLVSGTYLEPALRAERDRARHERRPDTERRRATILFADITGFTSLTERAGAERAYPVVAGCLQLLDEIACKHGGTVEKYLGDCVMALFGVSEAIEDAPRAAVNAAIEMRRRVRAYSERAGAEMRLDVHSGINTGLGIAGDISGPLIRESAVMGEPVSVADELKDLAPAGHVYVGLEVYRATREVFEYRELEATAREDRNQPVRVFELLSEQERLHRARIGAERRVFSTLVGRENELASIRASVARLHDGQGGILGVFAEAGLGKSRLLAEVAASDEAKGVAWCEGRSVSTGRHLSFHTIADLCRSLVGIAEADDSERALGKLTQTIRDLLPDEVDEVLPFIGTLLGLEIPPSAHARVSGLQGDAMEKLTLRSVTQLVRARSSRQPVVVILDDLHWADVSSIELAESLLRLCEEHPILFVSLARRGAATTSDRIREVARTRYEPRYVEIELRPLDAGGARSMLNNLFRQEDLPHATRQLIEEKARGNPFYIEEVIRALVDAGAVEFVEGGFRATEKIGSVAIPGSINELVMARIDGLDLGKRQLLQTASVIGGTFGLEVLSHVVESAAPLGDDLDALVHAEFLAPSERAAGREYSFKHPLIQEVTYDSLLHTRRQALHRKVGEAMEGVLPEDMPGYAGMLAYHYGKGGVVDRAEAFLFRAGADAARAAAPSEALHFFEEASKLYLELHQDGGDPAKRALLEKNIAQALYYRGRFLEAIDHFNHALRLLGDRVTEGRLELGLRFVVNMLTVFVRLYAPGVDRFTSPPATDRQREIMELRYARAEATVTSQPTRHLFDSMDSLAFLQRIDPQSVPLAGKFYAGAAAMFAFGGLSFGVSRRLSSRAHALVRPGSLDEFLYERAMNFTYRVLEGDWADDHEIEPVLVAESVRNGQLWGPTTYLGLLAEKRIHRGQFASARACLEEIDRIWDLFQYDLAKTNHYYLDTVRLLEQGKPAETIDAANAYYEENPEDLLHILALGAKAKAQTQLGDLDAAEETLRHAASVVARSSPVPPFHASSYHRSRFLLDVTRLERAGTAVQRRLLVLRTHKSMRAALGSAAKVAWRRTEVLRLAGRYHWLLGRPARARRFFDRSIVAGEALGARPETARTYVEMGRLLVRARPDERFRGLDAAGCVARARATFEELGLDADLERAGGSTPAHA